MVTTQMDRLKVDRLSARSPERIRAEEKRWTAGYFTLQTLKALLKAGTVPFCWLQPDNLAILQ